MIKECLKWRERQIEKGNARQASKSNSLPAASESPKAEKRSFLPWLIGILAVVGAFRAYIFLSGGEPKPVEYPSSEIVVESLKRSGEKASGFQLLSPEQTGVDHTLPIDTSHPMKHLYFSGTTGGGVAIGDIDNDGRPDLFFVNGPQQNRLFRQIDEFKFEDISEAAQIGGGENWGTGAAMIDINNDGRLDIYVCNYDAPNELYINLGNGKFVEQAVSYGLNLTDASMMPAFCDYDRDGDLDLYLLTYRFEPQHGHPKNPPYVERNGQRTIKPEFKKYFQTTDDDWKYEPVGRADGLLRNNGDGTFTDASSEAGISGLGHGLSATWWDYDDDGWPDLYVANDFMDTDQVYHNNGDGTFEDVTLNSVPHTSWYSMGSDFGDLNGDGKMDLLVADMSATTHYKQKTSMGNMGKNRWFLENAMPRQYMRNALLLNSGTHRFQEAAYLAGLADSDWTWTVKLVDFDNDGRLDVYFTNGSPRDFTNSDIQFHGSMLIGRTNWDVYEKQPKRNETNLAFRNGGDLRFDSVAKDWGLDHHGISMAAAHADLDGDGDLDLVVANIDEPVSIYKNIGTEGNAITVRLHGRKSNRFGIGATIKVKGASGAWVRQLSPATGFLASNQPIAHFGLGSLEKIDELVVHWPSGHVQRFLDLSTDSALTITEPEGDATPSRKRSIPDTLFATNKILDEPTSSRKEEPFDDYAKQPLLPFKLSQLGPGMASADVNGDGIDDLYIGGSAGKPGQLWISTAGGTKNLALTPVPAFKADKACEDMGALWFDIDSDNDLDLYVVSGGYEFDATDQLLRDRVYINDNGQFKVSKDHEVCASSGSCVVGSDFDRDGDIDLFVGSRIAPGAYPTSGASSFLRNDDGKLVDATDEVNSDLKMSGMVTSATWADIDQDGFDDLLVASEWGSIECWRNSEGKLINETKQRGLASRVGWWNSISAADFDEDGDLDFVVGNFGLNSKYHASEAHPALLYYGDFDRSGTKRLIEAEFEDGKLYPGRGKSCSTHAMPFLGPKFPTFHDFATASLTDVYTDTCLQEAMQFAANSLESGILFNDGGSFRFESLPRIVQIAPVFGSVCRDFNFDGHVDLLLAQNFYSLQPETGRADGGLSQVLLGDGKGAFQPMSPVDSGVIVPFDAKSAISIATPDGVGVAIAPNDANIVSYRINSNGAKTIRVVGKPGNPNSIGAKITFRMAKGDTADARGAEGNTTRPTIVKRIVGGGGYLSQSSNVVVVPDGYTEVSIEWPSGETVASPPLDAPHGIIQQP